jgi:ABC-2 type transport system permease protein
MGILFFVVIYLAIRLVKPELMVDPEIFNSVLVYVTALKTPSSPLLPSTWAFDSLSAGLSGSVTNSLFHMALSWSFAGTIAFVAVVMADKLYFPGYSKTQTGASRLFSYRTSQERLLRFLPGTVRAYLVKEIKTFFRDQTQWSQLFLIGTLIVIYVYNFDALPLERSPIKTVYLQNLLAFLNMGLATFVLTAVTARFAYPAISTEKEAFWIVKSSPLPIKTYLWIKFLIYYLPLLVLCEILIIATNILLQVTPFMMALSVATVFLVVPGIVAMGIGLGAAFPDFKAENPTQTVTSFGGLMFMILCAGFIGAVIMLESGPVYSIFMASFRGEVLSRLAWLWTIVSFAIVIIISLLALIIPMRFGARRLAEYVI